MAERSTSVYFHGYSNSEQKRLIRQAEYWRDTLIPMGLTYRPGERVLEVGCAVGATLTVLNDKFPGILVHGVDIEPRQIEAATQHLAAKGVEAELLVADASSLPFETDSVDHVYMMWLIEHLRDATSLLREVNRILVPGGTIVATETDYTTFKITPQSEDWNYVERAQRAFFERFGNPIAGRQLGNLLSAARFRAVRSQPVGFHFFQGGHGLRDHIQYVTEFLEPGVDTMARLGFDAARIRRGINHLRSVCEYRDGSMTQIIYRAHAVKNFQKEQS